MLVWKMVKCTTYYAHLYNLNEECDELWHTFWMGYCDDVVSHIFTRYLPGLVAVILFV